MIEETAQVVRLTDEFVWLQVQRQSACGKCSMSSGCGTSILANFFNRHPQLIKLPNTSNMKIGQQVVLGMEEDAMLRGSILIYLIPLVSMLVFAIVGRYVGELSGFNVDISSILFAIFGLYISAKWIGRTINRSNGAEKIYQPKILKII